MNHDCWSTVSVGVRLLGAECNRFFSGKYSLWQVIMEGPMRNSSKPMEAWSVRDSVFFNASPPEISNRIIKTCWGTGVVWGVGLCFVMYT